MRSYTLYKISKSKFKKKKPPVMCLPSKKLYRGASCLFCLKKWFQCQNILPSFFAHPLNAWTCRAFSPS